MKKIVLIIIINLFFSSKLLAAVGCTLNNPAEDLKYLYPDMSSYREELRNFEVMESGRELYEKLKLRLGGELDAVYETFETPYTVYMVFKGTELIGIVHGVNVPGQGGVIQTFLATDPKSGEIKNFFYQRIESPAAKIFRQKEFRSQFHGLSLTDFYKHDYYKSRSEDNKSRLSEIKIPSSGAEVQIDFEASLKGIRKNLILLDMFVYNQMSEPYFVRAQQALKQKAIE